MTSSYTSLILRWWVFLLVLLRFSIGWGWLMLKTEILWRSALFHTGADLLVIVPIFSTFGAM